MEEAKSDMSSGAVVVTGVGEDGTVDVDVLGATMGNLALDPRVATGFGTDDALDLVEQVCKDEFQGGAAVVFFGGTVVFTPEPGTDFKLSDAILMMPGIKRKGTAGVSTRGADVYLDADGYNISTLQADAFEKFGVPGSADHGSFRRDLVGPDGRPTDRENYVFTVGVTNAALDVIVGMCVADAPGLSPSMVKHIAILADNSCFRTYMHPGDKDFALTVARRPDAGADTGADAGAGAAAEEDEDVKEDVKEDDEELEAALEAFGSIGVLWNPGLVRVAQEAARRTGSIGPCGLDMVDRKRVV